MELTAGVTKASEGTDGTVWNILGQTYTPKLYCDNAFVWHAALPAEAFVPPHIHPTQDEWLGSTSSHSNTLYIHTYIHTYIHAQLYILYT